MELKVQKDWLELLRGEADKPYYKALADFVNSEYESKIVYPPKSQILNALNLTSYDDTRVVLLGQDPYHSPGFAHGLCFSVLPGVEVPRSLKNIFKELHSDLGCYIPDNGYLEKWARQGVLMLNTSLTVVEGSPNSHKGKGWEIFTDRIISLVNDKNDPVVFILWGANAQSKRALIKNPIHCIIKSAHPSPLSASRGFFGSRPFSRTNDFLVSHGQAPIDWQIENIGA
jgi:uracil-DNA glycosylase